MTREEQLRWESRMGRFAAAAAFATAFFIIAANIARASAVEGGLDTERELLVALSDVGGGFAAALTLQSLSYLTFAAVLYYLYRVTRARRPQTPRFAPPLAIVGSVLIVAGRVLADLELLDIADEFAAAGERSEARADDLLEDRSAVGIGLLQGGFLALALSLIVIPLNAMRAGVLSRFMGILGIVIGVFYVLPLLGGPLIVQLFWVVALGMLFLGRWPGGRGPAWETGEATPWPSAADRRLGRVDADRREEELAPVAPGPEPSDEGPAEHPASKKRKRKRRR